MKYQIDQSGKIEDTAKNTVIAYANGSQRAIVIPAKIKRQLQEEFRNHGLTQIFIYQVFAVGVYFLLKEFKRPERVVIDLEYPGKDIIIGQMITKLLLSHNKPVHEISFARIGSRPKAHYAAKDVFDGKRAPEVKISYQEVIGAIKTADGHLRECLSTLVDAQPRLLTKVSHKGAKKSRRK